MTLVHEDSPAVLGVDVQVVFPLAVVWGTLTLEAAAWCAGVEALPWRWRNGDC